MSEAEHRFDRDVSLRREAPGRHTGELSDGWGIYGFPNGGFLAALMARAIASEVPHADPFTVTTHYLRAARPGPCAVDVETLREGRGHSTAAATLRVDGEAYVRTTATFGDLDGRRGATFEEGRLPSLPPPADCALRDGGPGEGSTFGARLEMRFAPGTTAFLDGQVGGPMELGGWMRLSDGRAPDALSLLLFADAMPPPVLRVVERVWVPTLELTVHVRRRPRPGWVGAWFTTRALIDGYLEEDGVLFDEAGRLLAISRQLARVQTAGA